MSDKQKQKRGFTLVELLVVIAIIGNLSVIAIINLNDARALARDAVRMSDLNTFSKGLELYYSTYGVYPCGNGGYEYTVGGITKEATVDSTSSCDYAADAADHSGFLNGPGTLDPNPIPVQCHHDNFNVSGLFKEGILYTNCPKDPKNTDGHLGQTNYGYWYNVSGDRQSFALTTYLERNQSKRLNDGGGCTGYYEVLGGLGEISVLGFPEANMNLGPPNWNCASN